MSVLARILLLAALLLLCGNNSYAVTLAWDANTEEDLAGYKIYWGSESRNYTEVANVGNVTTVNLDIPLGSYVAATAYIADDSTTSNLDCVGSQDPWPCCQSEHTGYCDGDLESDFSNEIYYNEFGEIHPASGGTIVTLYIDAPENLYAEGFESYTVGDDPANWLDTEANNNLTERDLFGVIDLNGNKVFGTDSTWTNIHSHLVDAQITGLSSYEYSGRLMMTSQSGGIGITFFSDYPNSDSYYRFRQYDGGTFHISPHNASIEGDIESEVSISADVWYNFKIQIADTGAQTEIKAKIWTGAEPDWQVNCYDDSEGRFTSGIVGLWSHSSGSKYWDNLNIK